MSLYPSVEDMNVQNMANAQISLEHEQATGQRYTPAMENYMGESVAVAVPAGVGYTGYKGYKSPAGAVAARSQGTVAVPLTHAAANYQKAKIHEGVNEIRLVPDVRGKLGFKVKSVSKGIFVQCIIKDLPASKGGLRFGDQILQINGENVAGYSSNKAHDLVVAAAKNGLVSLNVRQRPFERTIVLKKDSTDHLGFEFKKAKINAVRKDSSAARNGLLTDHYFTEVNGQSVVAMDDNEILKIIKEGGASVTLTIVPEPMYKVMIKNLASRTQSLSDHSIPEL